VFPYLRLLTSGTEDTETSTLWVLVAHALCPWNRMRN